MYPKPYQGLSTFLKSPPRQRDRPIGVLGIPFDGATSFMPGTRFGPEAIRSASSMLTDGGHPVFGIEPAQIITDLGDVNVSNLSVEDCLDLITQTVRESGYVGDEERRLICMGGDHTVSLGILRGLAPSLAPSRGPLQILHVDAHCDTWGDHFGDGPIGHGTWVRNVIDEGLVGPENVHQVGIRSPCDPITRDWLRAKGGRVYSARAAMRAGINVIVREIREDCPVYVSFDIDALDPAHAPGTGTPEVGGLSSAFALDLLEGLRRHTIVGMDVVEVNPLVDSPSKITSLAAATMIWTVAAMMGVNRPGG